jgi:hypothetical protein
VEGAPNQQLTFQPKPFATLGGNATHGLAAVPTADVAPETTRYYLEISPMEGVNVDRPVDLTVSITYSVPGRLYLPLVVR